MIYQVRANLFFDTEDEARDFYHDCELAFCKATSINLDTEAAEFATIELIENHHDETPNGACFLLDYSTLGGPIPD